MKKILFIDDDIWATRVTIDVLKTEGFEVLAAPTVKDAIEIAKRESEDISVILLDLMMPHYDIFSSHETNGGTKTGIVLYKKYLKQILPHASVIVLTATDAGRIPEITQEPAVKAILSRPVSLFEIIKIIKAILS